MPAIDRLAKLRAAMAAEGVDALLVTNLTNVRYLTGFSGSAAVLAVGIELAALTTDGRYRTQAADEVERSGAASALELTIGGLDAQVEALLGCFGSAKSVGLEADHLSWSAAERWRGRLEGRDVVATSDVVERLRLVKDSGELVLMAEAARIADEALADVLEVLGGARGPVTERAFAQVLDARMKALGAEDVAFETIVAAGENSARPHHHPGDREVRSGDPVVVDFGAKHLGYRSDMTRTFSIGGAPVGQLAEIFDTVLAAQRLGVAAVRPGATTVEVDAACRDHIAAAGYAEAFEHSTGHGVGLDIHEAPGVGAQEATTLEPGMVVTVEPGIYLAGVGGVRIEDTLVVTETGSTPLTKFHKDVVL